ncbi:hypothetical protein Taro_041220 [Colocasia esculenta]|uniref:Uncharacterized protein n=1 Tax=Colocasia esculenta TaxID=4460 RepID=A0A843WF88_COLES|nr:hypothetical protein [Colocasia esculenta]
MSLTGETPTPFLASTWQGGAPAAEAEQDISPEDAAWVDSYLVKDGVNGPASGEGRSDYQADDAWAALTKELIDTLAYSASENDTATATHEEKKKKVESSAQLRNLLWKPSLGSIRVDASGDELMMYEPEYAVTA